MKSITCAAAALVAALSAGLAAAGASEDAVAAAVAAYRVGETRGTWTSPILADVREKATVEQSADKRLQAIVAGYSREMLDRGGWVNHYVGNASYASGNPLLTEQIGGGITSLG